MSAATSLALNTPAPTKVQRRVSRFPIKVPLDVTISRFGVSLTLPGRCTDLSEEGVGAMIAGDLSAGQRVGIEMRLPNVGLPLRTKAQVRYQGPMRCGLEFTALPREQRDMIRYWAQRSTADAAKTETARRSGGNAKVDSRASVSRGTKRIRISRPRTEVVAIVLAGLLALAAAGWWQWQRSWSDLESVSAGQIAPLRVSPEIMAARIVSKVEPVYPEEARRAGKQGLAVLDAVIAADGNVRRLSAISGDDALAKSAADAVRQWKFEPYRAEGRALEVETSIAVEFRLN